MPNTIKQLKEIFKDQLNAPVAPELLSFFVYHSPGPGVCEYKAQRIAPNELKLLKDHVFSKYTTGVILPIFSLPPKAQDVDSNEA